jgi:UDP-N-acetylmuramoyl-L-alanyl-D-glutamate--2,6-diaminopimelate ligase
MILRELVNEIGIDLRRGSIDIDIKGIAYDSRSVEEGFVFVAIRGFTADGHDYIREALSRGAIAVVTDRDVRTVVRESMSGRANITHIAADDTRVFLALISSVFHGKPSEKLRLIGITGTNGKTTTAHITRDILRASGKNTGMLGTIKYELGERRLDALRTTPESLDIQRYLKEMVDHEIEYSVLEVSSHALTLERVRGCKLEVALFTNFSRDHLDFHATMDEYFRAKSRIFTYLGDGGTAVLNIDDPAVRSLTGELSCNVITCGLEESAMFRAVNISGRASGSGLSFQVRTPEGCFDVESELAGTFNVYNLLMAVAAVHALGISVESIQKGVRALQPVSGRFETVDEGQDFLTILDYAHTEDSLEKVILEARRITDGKVITVFGCGGDRDRGKRPLMGSIASELSDFVIVTSDNPRSEEPSKIIRDILRGIKKENCLTQPDRAKAIRDAVDMAGRGDTVIIAGKGHEDYQEIEGVRVRFSDREVLIRELRRRLETGNKQGGLHA